MDKTYLWFTPAIGVAIGILALSTFLAVPIQIEGLDDLDKLEHSFAYLTLTIMFLVAFHKTGNLSVRVRIIVFLTAGSYGVLMELLQYYFFEYRHFEWNDAIANVVGTVIGFIFFGVWQRWNGN